MHPSRINDKRGNNTDRRNRKLWMLSTAQYGGDGTHVNCVHCGNQLDYETVQADRIKPGGSYRRSNVQPSCQPCNIARGGDETWVPVGYDIPDDIPDWWEDAG